MKPNTQCPFLGGRKQISRDMPHQGNQCLLKDGSKRTGTTKMLSFYSETLTSSENSAPGYLPTKKTGFLLAKSRSLTSSCGSPPTTSWFPSLFLVIPTHPSSQHLLHHTTNPSKAVENRHLMTKGPDGSGAFNGIRKMTHAGWARSA